MISFGVLSHILLFSFVHLNISYGRITFYTSTYPPFSDCSNYSTNSDSHAVFGAEIELVRSAFAFLNLTEGVDYTFDCSSLNRETLAIKLTDNEDSLKGLIGGITMTSERIENKFSFCQPTVSFPIRLVYRQLNRGFFFTRGLDPLTWGLLFLTIFMIGGLLYLLEDKTTAYINMLYNVMCQIFLVADYPLSRFISKLVNYLSTFLVVITVIIFTAVSTNIFQADRDFGNSLNLYKIASEQVVYTNLIFTKYIAQFGISYASADIYNPEDLINQLDKVGIDFLLVDGPYSDYLARQHCEFYTSSNEVDIIHYAIMFHKQFPKELQTLISIGVTKAKQVKSFEEYVDEYYNKRIVSTCDDKIKQENGEVLLNELKGLWYVLFCSMGIALTFLILDRLRLIVKKNMNIYDLKGVRAKMDRKIQRRYATVFAINVTVSMQSIRFLKKLNLVALETHLEVLKNILPPSFLLFAFLRDHKNTPKIKDQPKGSSKSLRGTKKSKIYKKGKRLTKGTISKKSFAPHRIKAKKPRSNANLGASNFNFNNSRRKSIYVEKIQKDLEKPIPKRRNGVQPFMRIQQRMEAKKSTLLAQTNLAFNFNNKLHIKLDNLLERRSQDKQNISNLEENTLRSAKNTHRESKDETKIRMDIKDYIGNETKNFIGRIFGRKGIKKDTQINKIGNDLVAEKEASLDTELSKKKSEVLRRLSSLSLLKSNSNQTNDDQSPSRRAGGDSPKSPLKTSIFKDIRNKILEYESQDSHHIIELTNRNRHNA